MLNGLRESYTLLKRKTVVFDGQLQETVNTVLLLTEIKP